MILFLSNELYTLNIYQQSNLVIIPQSYILDYKAAVWLNHKISTFFYVTFPNIISPVFKTHTF